VNRLLYLGALAFAIVISAASGSALAASAQPLSRSTIEFPAAFTLTKGGSRVLFGERFTGRISWLNPATGTKTPLFTVPKVATAGEQGLLGLALSPSYPTDRRVWVYVTRSVSGRVKNQLLLINANASGFSVLRSFPAGRYHNGGRIMFGPDGKLYVVLGENGIPSRAQNLDVLAGKMLRLNPDGTVPSDNPRAGSPIIGYGIRNSFGFTFDPETGRLWETENGPECNDEINVVARLTLRNYGWGPSETCSSPPPRPQNTNQDGPNPVLPKLFFARPPALTGAAFCNDCGLASKGHLFFGDFTGGRIRRARLTAPRMAVASQTTYYDHPGPVLSLETPADGGPIYFSTPMNIFRLYP
jgi:glucose/arabinose dehydrogenase